MMRRGVVGVVTAVLVVSGVALGRLTAEPRPAPERVVLAATPVPQQAAFQPYHCTHCGMWVVWERPANWHLQRCTADMNRNPGDCTHAGPHREDYSRGGVPVYGEPWEETIAGQRWQFTPVRLMLFNAQGGAQLVHTRLRRLP